MKYSDFNLVKNGNGLLPVIVQDATTLKVLMLGYMNEEAFNKTLQEGKVTFFSRRKGALWTKGETSGNYLIVKSLYPDCDNDTLLVQAEPMGPTCHRGTKSCFDTPDSEGFIRELGRIIAQRHEQMPDKSYTTKLFVKGVKAIAKKVGEEASELIIEAVNGNKERSVYEASDLIYHLLVLLEATGCSIQDVEKELEVRHR
ncbi:MAG: bifunctional phosphoribosyl-AMP cyclohydrolase/phosphoribosyl-ATP diphosphatase HisIE [Bacteroidales bacterium]|nr:bifunctional phosphoribosyl-AMP cyclohydrolase/phosphoribosyl-ATP diphosphatase HisIE [Bacteroidales bacterium]